MSDTPVYGFPLIDIRTWPEAKDTIYNTFVREVETVLQTLQPLDATLTALAELTTAANQLIYSTGVDTFAMSSLTAFARTILDDADAATVRTTIGAQTLDATLTALAGLTTAADQLIYSTGIDTFAMSSLTAFARTILDDADAATVRTTIGAQTLDATLTALAGLTTATDQLIYSTGVDTFAMSSLTAFARTILDDADAATVRTTIGAQPLDATLTALAGLTTAANQLIYSTGVDTFAMASLTAFARTILDDADAATVRTTIGANDATNLTAGTLPSARISKSGPTTPSFVNSFTDAGATRYWLVGRTVYVAIDVNRTTTPSNNTNMFTLPVGYRPDVQVYSPMSFGQESPLVVDAARAYVTTAGAVTYSYAVGSTPGSTTFNMQGMISFPAA